VPLILTAQCKGEDIHAIRKQIKKLCYLLELITPSNKHQELYKLKQIQHLAGAINDCDVTIEYLNDCSNRVPGSAELARMERTQRHRQYVRLIEELKVTTWPMASIET
jgi:CHAD domain-containing protein